MTTETYTSKDGRVTVCVSVGVDDRYRWAVRLPANAVDRSFYTVPKALFPDPQLLADQVAEQQPKPTYFVEVHETWVDVRVWTSNSTTTSLYHISKYPHPDAVASANRDVAWLNERAEQAAAELNARAVER